ncbi:alpha/beta hydrolase [Aquitalea sp. FJL05]|uniref:alpha/beta hydrolase n=1 Tax=Aquitalea TaxID=407217 RepID=UPI000F5A27C1|nr:MULTISPECIES: alpha/beta hydrolase [Aquitalea]RQO68118.1 alpha/beta hydrolase [Aquitalea sp. FJL05]
MFPILLRIALLCGVLLLSACAQLPDGASRLAQSQRLLQAKGWQGQYLQAGDFSLFSAGPVAQAAGNQPITVYLEGDGLAWLNSDTPSDDPTPLRPVGLQLALQQPDGVAVYLARPCQYAQPMPPQCQQAWWTAARFSEPVVAALDQALDQLKLQYGARQINMVGYSGGAALALLLAERRSDVQLLISVAGNVDPAGWIRLHALSPLQGSLDPLAQLSQLHAGHVWLLSGAEDENIPPALAAGVAAHLTAHLPVTLRTMPGFTHPCCWVETWPALWREAATFK